MPRHTPSAKIERTRKWGAKIVAEGEDFAEASLIAEKILEREGRVLVHPFNDLAVMAGQGTFAIELLEDAPPLDYIVLPIGGGGLLSGSAIVTKAMSPQTRIIGVQVESYASLASFPEETPAMGGSTIAEGMAVLKLGARCLETVQPLLDRVLIVSELEVEAAVATLAEQARVVSEGAGAAALAAVVKYAEIFKGKRVGLPVTGGNISTRVFANTLLRALRRDGRILFLNMQIPDRPGLLADIARRISEAGGNIIEVSHQRLFAEPSVQSAELEVMIEARDGAHAEIIQHSLAQEYKLTRR
ncbi:Threonine dehydratase [Acetobacteraceae bacterium EV16P]|uniref:Threonine dehydratase n=2 Tax=Sorlinia euscelidii TaxID=3081148 RepID=A0ABU7U2M9_9PROT